MLETFFEKFQTLWYPFYGQESTFKTVKRIFVFSLLSFFLTTKSAVPTVFENQ